MARGKSSRNWIINYDKERTDPYGEYDSNLRDRLSVLFGPDVQTMSWDTIRNLAVPGMFDDRSGYQVAMNVIQCFSALRKSWHHYKYAKPDSDIAWRILRLQKSMNLTLAKFEELDMQQARYDLKLEFDGYRQQIDSEVEEE